MSITNINIKIKQLVLLRLINSGESLEDASSKAGLCINLSKNYLNPPKNPFAIFWIILGSPNIIQKRQKITLLFAYFIL